MNSCAVARSTVCHRLVIYVSMPRFLRSIYFATQHRAEAKRLEYVSQLVSTDLNRIFIEGAGGERVPPLGVKFCNGYIQAYVYEMTLGC